MTGLPASLGLVVVAALVIWKGSEYFERAAERLSKHYGLPIAVHGAIVVAVGVEGIVRAALSLGEIFDTPSFLLGG